MFSGEQEMFCEAVKDARRLVTVSCIQWGRLTGKTRLGF